MPESLELAGGELDLLLREAQVLVHDVAPLGERLDLALVLEKLETLGGET